MSKYIIEGGRPLNGTITPQGNKNEALPALMACLLTEEKVVLKNTPQINDVMTICEILDDLGVQTSWEGVGELHLQAKNIKSTTPSPTLCSRVRGSILLLGPMLSRMGKIELPLPGGDVIGARRIDTHFDGIKSLGGEISLGHTIKASLEKFAAGDIYMDEPSVTATENLILMSVRGKGKTTIHNAACEPHIVGLCKLLVGMGAKIEGIGSNRLIIEAQEKLHGTEYRISPDFMEVGSFLCLGAMTEGTITIKNVQVADLRFILKTLNRIGIHPQREGDDLIISDDRDFIMKRDVTGSIGTIYSGPWPAFPTDLMSVAITSATQAKGTMIFFEKMFESRMFFTDKLIAMGANIVLCDPHRIVVNGPSKLLGSKMSSPDVRAGMAVVMAALSAKGTSEIDNVYQIERGYLNIPEKLASLGAAIKRVDH